MRPVFVFDGGTPTLKRRTLIARRRRKEAAGVKLRKMAEKLLLAQLKCVLGLCLVDLSKNIWRTDGKQDAGLKVLPSGLSGLSDFWSVVRILQSSQMPLRGAEM